MHDHLRLIRDERGAPLEVIGSLSDITARKLLEQEQQQLITRLREAHDQLLQSEKMASIGQLAAGVAHEINNPIGFVNSNMSTLNRYVATLLSVVRTTNEAVMQAAPGTALAARIDAINREADLEFLQEDIGDLVNESLDGLKRVRDIVQSLKDFSHMGETDWHFADLHTGLETTLTIVANEIKYKATVERRYGELPEVKCLASQLNQVFMNLLVNAAQAIRERGVITIATGVDGDWVWVAISDTGCGIPAQNMNRIFEPFFTTKPVGSGTGLGLSLSYSVINKHGGRIEVASTPEVGTTFTIRLPITPPASLRPAT
jgi:signal transduction histidine kinase